ncbi:MAG: hypothetical protein HY447_00720 [Candidatus Omnitrophica bacterium]|nr:hypothetical protein [Candidatus Omnitrophota bacterium]
MKTLLWIALILFLFLKSPFLFAQPLGEGALSEKMSSIERRLTQIEAQQKEILAGQQKILAELDRIRIWTRRQ